MNRIFNHHTSLLVALSAVSILPASLAAQGVVSPAHFAGAEGPATRSEVIGRTQVPWRYLQVHDDLQGQAMTIRKLAFRRDGQSHASRATDAFSFICDIYVSTAATTSSTLDLTFDNNHGSDRTRVATLRLVQVPAFDPSVPADPNEIEIPFQTPFNYSGNGSLAWEIRVISTTARSTLWLDAVLGRASTNPNAGVRRFGTGCQIAGSTRDAVLSGSASANWANSSMSLRFSGGSLPPSGIVSLNLGLSNTSLGGLPLPFLLPGTDMDPSGACTLYNSLDITLPALTQSNGTLTTSVGFAPTPAMNGLDLYGQVVALDPMANRFGVVTTGSVQFHIVAPYMASPIGHLWLASLGSMATRTTAGGVITRFAP